MRSNHIRKPRTLSHSIPCRKFRPHISSPHSTDNTLASAGLTNSTFRPQSPFQTDRHTSLVHALVLSFFSYLNKMETVKRHERKRSSPGTYFPAETRGGKKGQTIVQSRDLIPLCFFLSILRKDKEKTCSGSVLQPLAVNCSGEGGTQQQRSPVLFHLHPCTRYSHVCSSKCHSREALR